MVFNEIISMFVVGGGGGGIQEWDFVIEIEMQDIFRILIVVIYYVFVILFGGGRIGIFVENCVDIIYIIISNNVGNKIFFIYVISDIQINQIDEFGVVFQVIYNQNIFIVDIIQCFNDVVVNEIGVVSDDNYQVYFC